MRPTRFHPEPLKRLLRRRHIATMPELKQALGTSSDATVFRKLAGLSYLTSYSHRGSYYTLREVAEFDENGLWFHRGVHFSEYGTLVSTAEHFVEQSEAGRQAGELESILQVSVKQTLLRLHREGRIKRERRGGRWIYCARDQRLRKKQLLARRAREIEPALGSLPRESGLMPDEVKAAIVLFFSLLDEKQRRLYAGLESLKCGHGGDRRVAELLDLDVGTIARGRQHLLEQDVEVDRVRRAGAGRKPVEKKHRRSSRRSRR